MVTAENIHTMQLTARASNDRLFLSVVRNLMLLGLSYERAYLCFAELRRISLVRSKR